MTNEEVTKWFGKAVHKTRTSGNQAVTLNLEGFQLLGIIGKSKSSGADQLRLVGKIELGNDTFQVTGFATHIEPTNPLAPKRVEE
jgi:hypothetical protein